MVLDAAIVERRHRAFQNIDDVPVDGWVLDGAGEIGDLRCILPIEYRPDNLLRITDDREIRIVGDHNDLPTFLSLGQDWDQ